MFRTTFDAENKQWNGVKTNPYFNRETSLGEMILNSLQVNDTKVAQICAITGKTKTFGDLHALTVCVMKNLQNLGFKKGQLIFFFTSNTDQIVPLLFAALCLGCPITSIPTCCTKKESEYFLKITNPMFVVCDVEYRSMLRECLANQKNTAAFFTFGDQADEQSIPINILFEKTDSNSFIELPDINGATDIAFFTRSSGTTGMPKGARISHAAILDKMRRLSHVIQSTDVMLGFTNAYAISGIRHLMAATLNGATRIVNPGPFSPERFFELVQRFEVTFFLSTAYIANQIVDHPQFESANLHSLKQYICAGTKASHTVILRMNEYLNGGKFCHSYGVTETIGTVSINFGHTRNDCVGQLISGCEAKIVNEQGERLDVGETGELCLKQPYLFHGYVGDDQSAPNYFDSEGFYVTGDIARFDENGDLFIVDRKKEQFQCCGYHVQPAEIEGFLNQIDGVKESCLVPIPHPKYDNLPAAVIVKTESSACTKQTIYDSISNNFAFYKRLRGGIYFVDVLPMTASGKIARNVVKQMAIELFHEEGVPSNFY